MADEPSAGDALGDVSGISAHSTDMDVVPDPSAEVDLSGMTLASDGTVLPFKQKNVKDAMFRLGEIPLTFC